MRGEIAGPRGQSSSNLIKFPGGRIAPVQQPRRPDADLLIAAAARVQSLAEHAALVRAALKGAGVPIPPGLTEWLSSVEGQIETWASLVEADALIAAGAHDVA